MTPAEIAMVWIGTAISLFGLSFIWFGDSIFFAFGEQLYLGAACAYTFFTVWKGLSASAFTPIAAGRVTLVISLIIGALAFARLTRWRWAARYPVATLSGIGVGVTFGLTIRSQILVQISDTLKNLIQSKPDPISAILILIGTLTALLYFTYTREHRGNYGRIVKVGRLFLMASFGYILATDNILHADGLIALLQNLIREPLKTLGIVW
jgi:hypothetical protein